eukprot:3941576-Rhodomonas_salina.2
MKLSNTRYRDSSTLSGHVMVLYLGEHALGLLLVLVVLEPARTLSRYRHVIRTLSARCHTTAIPLSTP